MNTTTSHTPESDGRTETEEHRPIPEGRAGLEGPAAPDGRVFGEGPAAPDGRVFGEGPAAQAGQSTGTDQAIPEGRAAREAQALGDVQAIPGSQVAGESQVIPEGRVAQDGEVIPEGRVAQDGEGIPEGRAARDGQGMPESHPMREEHEIPRAHAMPETQPISGMAAGGPEAHTSPQDPVIPEVRVGREAQVGREAHVGRDGSVWRDGAVGRAVRVIHNEATTEIPVHLLFRDDAGPAAPVSVKPAVVGRRQGTGEQPRVRRAVAGTARPVPELDAGLVERPAWVLPGTAGVLAGLTGVAGCAVTSWWAGVLPPLAGQALRLPHAAGAGLGVPQLAAYAGAGALGLFGFGGLTRGRTGRAWVLGLFGRYRGTVRRTGLMWVNPLARRRRVDVRLRHWRSEPMPACDLNGVALRVVVLVVWRVRDTARAVLGIEDHERYLRECVEAALARVRVEQPGAARGAAEAAGEALTRLVAREAAPVGLEVFSVLPVRAEYAPEVAAAMHRRSIAALDAQHRASVLTSVVDSVEDTVTRLTTRGLVELDDHERKVLVRDLTVAFCAGRDQTGR